MLQTTADLDATLVLLTSSMEIGKPWLSAVTITDNPDAGFLMAAMQTSVLVGLEDVTVPYNGGTTFTACLKISTDRGSNVVGNFNRISWHCPGIGEVRRMQYGTDDEPRLFELTDITM